MINPYLQTINPCETLDEVKQTNYQFLKHNLFLIFYCNIIQHRQIYFRTKLLVSKSSNMNERELFNEIQTIDFDDIIAHPQKIHCKKNIWNLLKHLKIFSKYFITFGSNRAI